MNILFWNLANNNFSPVIVQCLKEYSIDFAFFCEYQKQTIEQVITEYPDRYTWIDGNGGCDKVTALVSVEYQVTKIFESSRFTIYRIVNNEERDLSDIEQYNVACVHFSDKRNNPEPDARLAEIHDLLEALKPFEKRNETDNTIVIGDFNAEPYDSEMLSKIGMNAVLYKEEIVSLEFPKRGAHKYRRFYNPTLECISEEKHCYGSYRYDSGMVTPIWHFLDQVVMRKSLLNQFDHIEYPRNIGNTNLMKKLGLDSKNFSDHLPLIVFFK